MRNILFAAFSLLAMQGPVLAKEITVAETDHQGAVSLEEKDTLSVVLNGNPSTGYSWEVSNNDESVLKLCGKECKSISPGLCGSPAVCTFTFRPTSKKGVSELELVYRRPWEQAEPIHTFHITVTVE